MENDTDKLKDMQAQIDALKLKHDPKSTKGTDDAESMNVGMRAGTELVGAIGGAALIGYGIDRWLEIKPWGLIIMLLLGVAVGFMNVWKLTQTVSSAVGYKKNNDPQKKSLANSDNIPK